MVKTTRTWALAAVAGLTLLAGACSDGGSGKTVADVPGAAATTSATAAGNADPVAYAKCMRANGVPDFPDPDTDGRFMFDEGGSVNPESTAFKDADKKCQAYAPQGGKATDNPQAGWSAADKLKYAQCMRQNGITAFPDPDAGGTLPPIIQGSGIDPESDQFKKADEACKQYKPQGVPTANRVGGGS